jgi:hypothetical protein
LELYLILQAPPVLTGAGVLVTGAGVLLTGAGVTGLLLPLALPLALADTTAKRTNSAEKQTCHLMADH